MPQNFVSFDADAKVVATQERLPWRPVDKTFVFLQSRWEGLSDYIGQAATVGRLIIAIGQGARLRGSVHV